MASVLSIAQLDYITMPPAFHNVPWAEISSSISTKKLQQLTSSNSFHKRSKWLKSRSSKGLQKSLQLNQSSCTPEQKSCSCFFCQTNISVKNRNGPPGLDQKTEVHLWKTHQIIGILLLCVSLEYSAERLTLVKGASRYCEKGRSRSDKVSPALLAKSKNAFSRQYVVAVNSACSPESFSLFKSYERLYKEVKQSYDKTAWRYCC